MPQDPIDGVSFAYTFDDPKAEGRLLTQYFEIMGSRAIYHDGWMACAFGPRVPWIPGMPPGIREWTPDKDIWELYHLAEDWCQANDLAAKMPEKLAQMKDLFLIEATKNKALPIGGGLWVPLLHPEMRVAPPNTEWNFTGDITRMPEFTAPALWATSQTSSRSRRTFRPTPTVCSTSWVRNSGGLTLFVEDGILCYEYNLFIIMRTKIRATQKLPAGKAKIEVETVYVEPKPARSAESHTQGQWQAIRLRRGSGQRTSAFHRERLPRHRHRLGLTRFRSTTTKGAIQVQRHDRQGERQVHSAAAEVGACGRPISNLPYPVTSVSFEAMICGDRTAENGRNLPSHSDA